MRNGWVLFVILTVPLVARAQTVSSTTVTDNGSSVILAGDFYGDGGGDIVSVDASGNINCIASHGGLYDLAPIVSSVQNPGVFSYASAKLDPSASDYVILGSPGIVNVYSSASCLFTLTQTIIVQGVPTSILAIPNLIGDPGPDVAVISTFDDFAQVYENSGGTLSAGPVGLGLGIAGLSVGSAVAIENFVEPQPPGPLATVSISIWSYANNAWTNTASVTPPGIPMRFANAPNTNAAFLVSHDLSNIYIQQVEAGGTLGSSVSFSTSSEAMGVSVFAGDNLAVIFANGVQILQDVNGTGNWTLGAFIPVNQEGSIYPNWVGSTAALADGFVAQSQTGTATVFQIRNGSVVSNSGPLVFQSTTLGASSTLPLTVTNTGNEPLTTNGVSISGVNSADFYQTNDCTTLAPLGTCTVQVTYTPSTFFAESATLTILSDALNAPTSVALNTAAGPSPVVSTSSTSLDYGNAPLNLTETKTLTIGNSGTYVLSNLSVQISGAPFVLANSCPSTLAILASCSVAVNFSPVTAGYATGTLTIQSNVSPVTIPLQGIGVGSQPVVSSLSPANATAGGSGFTLIVNGSNFVSGSQVSFNLTNVATTFVSSSQLTALISASSITTAGNPNVTVTAPGSNVSAPVSFTVNNPAPQASGVSPAGLPAGSTALTLNISGTNFTVNSTVLVNGNSRATNYVNSTTLQATLLASDVAQGGTLNIAISNPPPGGGTTPAIIFNVADYAVTPPATPSTVSAGQPAAFVLLVAPSSGTFADPVTLSVSGLPPDATVSFSPSATVTPGAAPVNVTLSIATTAHAAATLLASPFGRVPTLPTHVAWFATFAAMLGFGLWMGRAKAERLLPRYLLASMLLLTAGLASCGGAGDTSSGQQINPATGTPAGTYTIAVIATSGTVAHTTNVTLTVI